MDATKSKRKSVRRSLNKELKNDVDIISSLPDHILSFLCTKLAVATCVLSRRWKYLWRSFCTLDFSYDYYFSEEYSRLLDDERIGRKKNFVDRMLLRHDMSDIQTFSYNGACDSYSLHSWIFTLIRHNVRKLLLSLENEIDDPIVLPSSFFSCESLTLLDIDVSEQDVKIPTLVSFPSLKILRLQNISFIQKELTHQVLFSCPKLKGLVLLDINWQKINTVQIKTPQLKNLVISDTDSIFPHDVVIEIYAESLISLELKSIFLYKYCLYNLFSLDIAIIDTWEYTDGEQYHYVDLLRGISNVKDLTLGLKSIEVLSHLDLSAYLLTFSSLTHLSIEVTSDVDLSDTIGTNLVDVLCKTPNIESLRFPDVIYGRPFKELGLTVETNPVCFLPHLKVIDFECFAGKKNELCLIDFFLKNVGALQKMNVEINQRIAEEKRNKIARHLRQLARHSNGVLEYFL